MKYLHLVVLILGFSPLTWAQPLDTPSKAIADSIFGLIQSRSVHRSKVHWPQLAVDFHARTDTAQTLVNQLEAFRYVFAQLGDVHSGITLPNQYINYYKPATADQANRMKPLLERARFQSGKFLIHRFGNGVAYILIPTINAMGSEQINAYAQQLQDSVCQLASQPVKGWIIDLRLNGGGNLYPMLSGIGNLIGEGLIGGQVDAQGQWALQWFIRQGEYYQDRYAMTSLQRKCSIPGGNQKVAVLLSPMTMSSGEAVAVALKGRKATRFFGESTAEGYTTVNNWHQITPRIGLNLAEGYFADRNGVLYKDVVKPDVTVMGGDNFTDLLSDEKIKAALAWLLDNQ